MKNQSASIIRALRKYRRITQEEFAQMIGITQGAQSKIEAEILELSAVQWVAICERFKIDPHCLFTGKIEVMDKKQVGIVHGQERFGAFKIPRNYSLYMGSTVRSVYPLLYVADQKMGEKRKVEFLKENFNIDPDYFNIMSNPLNLLFVQDLVNKLDQEKVFNKEDVKGILDEVPFEEAHHYILGDLGARGGVSSFRKFVEKIDKLYDANSDYEYIGDGEVLVRATDRQHIDKLQLEPDFKQFRLDFCKETFNHLKEYTKAKIGSLEIRQCANGWELIQTA